MTVREIIRNLEVSKKVLEDENKLLKAEIEELKKINKKLVDELNSQIPEVVEEQVPEEVEYEKKNPSDDENASKIEVEEVVEEVKSDGGFLDPVVEEVAEKPKRSRKKKVEPVEEPENA